MRLGDWVLETWMQRRRNLVALCLVGACGVPASADVFDGQISLTPGHWESSSSIEIVVVRGGEPESVLSPSVDVREQCLRPKNAILNPVDLAGPGCIVLSSNASEKGLRIDLSCSRVDGQYTGWVRADAGDAGLSTVAEMELTSIRDDGSELIIRALLSSRRSGPCLN